MTSEDTFPISLELVVWVDACSDDGWSTIDHALAQEPAECVSVGIVLKETPQFLTLVGTFNVVHDEVNQAGAIWTIPISSIVSRTPLVPQDSEAESETSEEDGA